MRCSDVLTVINWTCFIRLHTIEWPHNTFNGSQQWYGEHREEQVCVQNMSNSGRENFQVKTLSQGKSIFPRRVKRLVKGHWHSPGKTPLND